MLAIAIAAAAFVIGYALTRSGVGAFGSTPTTISSFEPKVAAEILRNTLMYSFSEATTEEEQARRIDRISLQFEGRLIKSGSAFERAAIMNAGGFAVLGPKTMWDYQPWDEKSAKIMFIEASNADLIALMAGNDSPWAVLVRAPGKLAKYEKMPPEQVLTELRSTDIA